MQRYPYYRTEILSDAIESMEAHSSRNGEVPWYRACTSL